MNSFLLTIKQQDFQGVGFSWGGKNEREKRSWLQYADDATALAPDIHSMQILLNTFEGWCRWANLSIRLNKCITFGMQKRGGRYIQYEPNISLETGKIPAVGIGESFTYLGRLFAFDENDSEAKASLEDKLNKLLATVDTLKINAQLKIKFLSSYIHSQILYELKTYNFSMTWIEQSLDATCFFYIRR